MQEPVYRFDDGAGYERYMGQWSRAAGIAFLDWAGAPSGARWLDVGCGTGVFTELVLDRCDPAAVTAVDPAAAQIEHAARGPVGQRAAFRVANAEALPFADATFDVVASALVINFVADRPRALDEMRRVARLDGLVAGYVWDYAVERSPSWPMRRGMRRAGLEVPPAPGTADSRLDALRSLFESAGLEDIATTAIAASVPFSDFDAFWSAQTPSHLPTTKMIDAMTDGDRARLIDAVRAELPIAPDGTIAYSARAHAIKARVPS